MSIYICSLVMQMDVCFCGVVFWVLFFCICRLHHKVPVTLVPAVCNCYLPASSKIWNLSITHILHNRLQTRPTPMNYYYMIINWNMHMCKPTLQHCFLAWTWTQCSAVHSWINVDTQHMVHITFLYSQTTAIQPSYIKLHKF